jgi:hypothetical protein
MQHDRRPDRVRSIPAMIALGSSRLRKSLKR